MARRPKESVTSHKLIVLPDGTAKPVVDAINAATKSLDIRALPFTDTTLIDVAIAVRRRGAKVRVMLNPARRSDECENEEARKRLMDAGIAIHDCSPVFALNGQKSIVIDESTGLVASLNREPKHRRKRDYPVIATPVHEVAEMVACFDADWDHKEFKPQPKSPLIWCPNYGRHRTAEFIDETRHTLWLQTERYQDQVIIERLVRAARREGAYAQTPQPARQDAAGRQQARHHRFDRHRARELRCAARTGDRDRRPRNRQANGESGATRLGRGAPGRLQ